MATSALRSLHLGARTSGSLSPPPTKNRLAACGALPDWLKAGGPVPVKMPRAKDAPPLLHLSDSFELTGTSGNLTFVAKRDVRPSHFVVGIAMPSVLHPYTDAVPERRRALASQLAHKIRSWRTGGEGVLGGADDTGRIDLILLLAMELLDDSASAWAPYLSSLPELADCAPPSLYPYLSPPRAIAVEQLKGTSIEHKLATDRVELEPLFGSGGDAAARTAAGEVLAGLASASPSSSSIGPDLGTLESARAALLRSIALVSTRMIGGVGLVPLLDLANGAVKGRHNATIERTKLAASQEAKEDVACVAVLTEKDQVIKKGQELVLSYGELSAADFFFKYGWVEGGPDDKAAAVSPSDAAYVVPRSLWPSLGETHVSLLSKYGITKARLGVDEGKVTRGSFAISAAEAALGRTPPLMKQVALIASITNAATLAEIAKTGKLSNAGVGSFEINNLMLRWCAEHVVALGASSSSTLASDVSVFSRLAARVNYGERTAVLKWMTALKAKQQEGSDSGGSQGTLPEEVVALIEAATKKDKVAVKKLKGAIKAAEEGQSQGQGGDLGATCTACGPAGEGTVGADAAVSVD